MNEASMRPLSFRNLHRKLDEAIFAIPQIQREFVWNGRKAADLLDSVYRHMPIGCVIVWDTSRENQHLLRKNLHILPPFRESNKRIWFLIDGQQRLSVLYQATRGDVQSNATGREIDFSHLTFSLAREENGAKSFHYRRPLEGEFVSVRDILSPRWSNRFRDLPEYKLKRIRLCRSRLLSYEVPFLFVKTGDLEEIRQLFVRINSLGTPIGSADRAFSRATAFDIRSRAREARESLPPLFRNLPYETILQAFALNSERDPTDVGERAYEMAIRTWERKVETEREQLRDFDKMWTRLRKAVGKAVDYLCANFDVQGPDFLPSVNMIATLSVFFYHAAQAHRLQRLQIRKWFWATAVAERYSGRGYRENLLNDAKFFRGLATTRRGLFHLDQLVDPLDLRKAAYSRRTSLANGFFCLLLSMKPRYVNTGEPVPLETYTSRANRRDQHHIFPKALLASYGFDHKLYNSICNICLIVAEENQQFGSKSPRTYLEQFRRRRFFGNTMRSHLIPHSSQSAIWSEGVRKAYLKFLNERRQLICRSFEEAAGIKLFRKPQ